MRATVVGWPRTRGGGGTEALDCSANSRILPRCDAGAQRGSVRRSRRSPHREKGMKRFPTARTLSLALALAWAALPGFPAEPAPARDYPIQPVPINQTEIA